MKKFTLIISALCMSFASAFAQTYVIHKTDGTTIEYQARETEYIEFKETDNTPEGVEAVDLGLSVKWANMNLGADDINGCGNYYAWGEIEPKSAYYLWNYKFYKNTPAEYKTTIDADGFETKEKVKDELYGYTKYVHEKTKIGYDGFHDNKNVLDYSDDAAYMTWGAKWRIPKVKEFKELVDKCTWAWATLRGTNGYKVTGPNGNWIFLPAAGYVNGDNYSSSNYSKTRKYSKGGDGYFCANATSIGGKNTSGNYYARSFFIDEEDLSETPNNAGGLTFTQDAYYSCLFYERYRGCSIRPVQEY